jgi:uncharacterized membrane protein
MVHNGFQYLFWAIWLVPAVLLFFHIVDDMKRNSTEWQAVHEAMAESGWSAPTKFIVTWVLITLVSIFWPVMIVFSLITGKTKK